MKRPTEAFQQKAFLVLMRFFGAATLHQFAVSSKGKNPIQREEILSRNLTINPMFIEI